MSEKENELREKWNTINYYSGGALKLSVEHPLEWYVRYAMPEHKSVVIVSKNRFVKMYRCYMQPEEGRQICDFLYADG